MLDPSIGLASAMHSKKGLYALLLGSGISRSAGIPTGWEIVLDLIKRIAEMVGEKAEPNPEAWYLKKFGESPRYSALLEKMARDRGDRSYLLRKYFEPTEEEREQGLKTPTAAHRSIADLVRKGYIRVIVTTNFDRLLEKALEEKGISPIVLSTSEAVAGAIPLVHSDCTILKVHGDYLDVNIRNTEEELSGYDEPVNGMLDRIFDEYGLVVCGWSGEWDIALKSAMERARNRRFGTYWVDQRQPGDAAQRLITQRQADLILQPADAFFGQLNERVSALEEFGENDPLSAKIVVAVLKRCLSEEKYRIRVHDLLVAETERLHERLASESFSPSVKPTKEGILSRIKSYESDMGILATLMSVGCYWGKEYHIQTWRKCLEKISTPPDRSGQIVYEAFDGLKSYPALIMLYACGVACLAGGRYSALSSLLNSGYSGSTRSKPLLYRINTWETLDVFKSIWQSSPQNPVSNRLYSLMKETTKEFILEESELRDCFDRFEYLAALSYADFRDKVYKELIAPIGLFAWSDDDVAGKIEVELNALGSEWPPLKAGLFGGSLERVWTVKQGYDKWVADRRCFS